VTSCATGTMRRAPHRDYAVRPPPGQYACSLAVSATGGTGPRKEPPPNDFGILLARAFRSQVQDLTLNLPACLPVLKRAPSSAVYEPICLETYPLGYPRSSDSLLGRVHS